MFFVVVIFSYLIIDVPLIFKVTTIINRKNIICLLIDE